jgi:hypothetical protein
MARIEKQKSESELLHKPPQSDDGDAELEENPDNDE